MIERGMPGWFRGNAKVINRMTESLERRMSENQSMAGDFRRNVDGVVTAVTASADQTRADAVVMNESVARTAREVSSAGAAITQVSERIRSIAEAADDLARSIGGIDQFTGEASTKAAAAVAATEETDRVVSDLAEAAQKIGEVVRLISDIAEQTNLLALNATIEAARAGEAGKGFAVVAGEVKRLATQTAKATGEISAQVGAIQASTGSAVTAIKGIGSTIREVDAISGRIAHAVAGQGQATAQITRSVQETVSSTDIMTASVGEVSAAAAETGAVATRVLIAAEAMSGHSDGLRKEVSAFLQRFRIA